MTGAYVASHNVNVMRRSDDKWVVLGPGELVGLDELIRLDAHGIKRAEIKRPHFEIRDSSGALLFERSVNMNLAGNAWIDTKSPSLPGTYTLIVHAQSFTLLPFTHEAKTTFIVSKSAGDPVGGSPGLNWGKLLLPVGIIAVAGTIGFIAIKRLGKGKGSK